MQAWDLLITIIGQHLLPTLLASALIWGALALLFGLGKLRRPAYRVVFLYAALLKAVMGMWQGEGISCLRTHPPLAGYAAFSLPNVVHGSGAPLEARLIAAAIATSDLSSRILAAVLVVILGFCLYRWARIAPVYRGLHAGELADAGGFARAYGIFDGLVARAWRTRRWQPRPRLLVIRGEACSAFTMGIRSPVVVVSAGLIEHLGEPELRGVLAHELAHVRRADYLGRWLATVARDLMIWNPFAVLWYRQLVQEQEKASDAWAAALLDDPGAVASGLVEVVAYAGGFPLTSIGQLAAWRPGEHISHLETRLGHLEDFASDSGSGARWRQAVDCTLLGAFALVQPHITMPVAWWFSRARELL